MLIDWRHTVIWAGTGIEERASADTNWRWRVETVRLVLRRLVLVLIRWGESKWLVLALKRLVLKQTIND